VTVDVPTANAEPETGEQELLSTGMPATEGRGQLTMTGDASTDCRATAGGQDMRAAVVWLGGVGAVGESLPQLAVSTASMSARRARDVCTELLGQNTSAMSSVRSSRIERRRLIVGCRTGKRRNGSSQA
jgi:hypothetical protein